MILCHIYNLLNISFFRDLAYYIIL